MTVNRATNTAGPEYVVAIKRCEKRSTSIGREHAVRRAMSPIVALIGDRKAHVTVV